MSTSVDANAVNWQTYFVVLDEVVVIVVIVSGSRLLLITSFALKAQ